MQTIRVADRVVTLLASHSSTLATTSETLVAVGLFSFIKAAYWSDSIVMAATLCQVMGFLISLVGLAGIMAATGMDQWATQDLNDSIITAVYSYSGLWRSCFRQSSGFTECRPYFTILGLPGNSTTTVATYPSGTTFTFQSGHCCFFEVEKLRNVSFNFRCGILGNYRVNLHQKFRTFLKSRHFMRMQRLKLLICWLMHNYTFIHNLMDVKSLLSGKMGFQLLLFYC